MSTNQEKECVRGWMSDLICPNVLAWHGSLTMLEIKKKKKQDYVWPACCASICYDSKQFMCVFWFE